MLGRACWRVCVIDRVSSCEGEYRTQEASIDSVAEDMFGGTMHVALVKHEGQFVEVRLQAYEGDMKMPLQTYALMIEAEETIEDEAPAAMTGPVTAASSLAPRMHTAFPADELKIDATADAITLHQSTERGPIIRARVDGKPLVPTRELVATVDMRLDRINGNLSLVWGESRVKDHKIPAPFARARSSFVTRRAPKPSACPCASVPSDFSALPARRMVAGCVQQPVSQRDQPRLGGLGQSAAVRKGRAAAGTVTKPGTGIIPSLANIA